MRAERVADATLLQPGSSCDPKRNLAIIAFPPPHAACKHANRRSRPDQWADAINTLMDCLDRYQQWRENLPDSLADSALAERLDTMLEWRDLVDQLSLADPPRGFGRD